MRVGVYIQSPHDSYVYGMTIVEKDYVSCYDAREAGIALINKIFNDPEFIQGTEFNNRLTVILGGAAPYEATFYYKTVSEEGII